MENGRVQTGAKPANITAGSSSKILPPSAMTLGHRKGVFIVSLRLTTLVSNCFQKGSFKIPLLPALKR